MGDFKSLIAQSRHAELRGKKNLLGSFVLAGLAGWLACVSVTAARTRRPSQATSRSQRAFFWTPRKCHWIAKEREEIGIFGADSDFCAPFRANFFFRTKQYAPISDDDDDDDDNSDFDVEEEDGGHDRSDDGSENDDGDEDDAEDTEVEEDDDDDDNGDGDVSAVRKRRRKRRKHGAATNGGGGGEDTDEREMRSRKKRRKDRVSSSRSPPCFSFFAQSG